MKRLNLKGTAILLSVCAATALCVNLANSCSADDDYFGLDDESYSYQTRASTSDTLGYLSLPTYNPAEWTENDFKIVGIATERIGVNFSKSNNRYEFQVANGKTANISDSLYYVITSMFEHTNMQMSNPKKKKLVRRKTKAGDVNAGLPDCVPAAVANMGVNPPTYTQAIAKCDKMFPNWRTSGGVPTDQVESFIKIYAPVTCHTNMNFCTSVSTSLNKLVTVFNTGTTGHAVNAYGYVKAKYTTIIYYEDHSSTSIGNGSIFEEQLIYIFQFY